MTFTVHLIDANGLRIDLTRRGWATYTLGREVVRAYAP